MQLSQKFNNTKDVEFDQKSKYITLFLKYGIPGVKKAKNQPKLNKSLKNTEWSCLKKSLIPKKQNLIRNPNK